MEHVLELNDEEDEDMLHFKTSHFHDIPLSMKYHFVS